MDFYEIDFIKAGEGSSGDAIALRYQRAGEEAMHIHVVDGGYSNDGQKVVDHLNQTYGNPVYIDNVVVTHPDRDHSSGLLTVLENFTVGALWMNRPWIHVNDLLPRFDYAYTEAGLVQRLKRDFPYIAQLEDLATRKSIPIFPAFQGQEIGPFTVLSPSYPFYLDMVVSSEKTPEPDSAVGLLTKAFQAVAEAARYVSGIWGVENLKGDITGTSSDNESSVVQYAYLGGDRILLTGDAGIQALTHAHAYATTRGLVLPGIDKFHVPHHGARRNLSTPVLDMWLGPRLPVMPASHELSRSAMISAHENDKDHPRKAVVRALWHRGMYVGSTQGKGYTYWKPKQQAWRPGTQPLEFMPYPDDMEE